MLPLYGYYRDFGFAYLLSPVYIDSEFERKLIMIRKSRNIFCILVRKMNMTFIMKFGIFCNVILEFSGPMSESFTNLAFLKLNYFEFIRFFEPHFPFRCCQ